MRDSPRIIHSSDCCLSTQLGHGNWIGPVSISASGEEGLGQVGQPVELNQA